MDNLVEEFVTKSIWSSRKRKRPQMSRDNMLRCNSQGFYSIFGRYESTDVRSTLPSRIKWKKSTLFVPCGKSANNQRCKGKEIPKGKKICKGVKICLTEKISKCKMETRRK